MGTLLPLAGLLVPTRWFTSIIPPPTCSRPRTIAVRPTCTPTWSCSSDCPLASECIDALTYPRPPTCVHLPAGTLVYVCPKARARSLGCTHSTCARTPTLAFPSACPRLPVRVSSCDRTRSSHLVRTLHRALYAARIRLLACARAPAGLHLFSCADLLVCCCTPTVTYAQCRTHIPVYVCMPSCPSLGCVRLPRCSQVPPGVPGPHTPAFAHAPGHVQ
eukprot:4205717-Pleurochrysis_carterae.AAC.1